MALKRSADPYFAKLEAAIEAFKSSPFSRYIDRMTDTDCRFLLNASDGSYKFRKCTQGKMTEDGKFVNIFQHGDVGTDGVTETVEYEKNNERVRALMKWSQPCFMDDYDTYDSIVKQREEEEAEKEKKAKKAKMTFPTLTATLVFPSASAGAGGTKAAQAKAKAAQAKTQVTWVGMLQEFLSTYEYFGDFHHLDYSAADPSSWSFYETHEAEEGDKDMKKRHTALIKKDSFAKQLSKTNPGTYVKPAEVQWHDYKIYELSIDDKKFFFLTYSMCYNDRMGHYNVLYDSAKKEIFRGEICDTSDPSIGTGVWKSPAMKKKFGSLAERIESFLVSDRPLGCGGDFTFDFDEEACV